MFFPQHRIPETINFLKYVPQRKFIRLRAPKTPKIGSGHISARGLRDGALGASRCRCSAPCHPARNTQRRPSWRATQTRCLSLTLLRENIESCRVFAARLLSYVQSHSPGSRPRRAEELARALRQTHGRYASYWNAVMAPSGHVWQGRYYSCPLDQTHLWEALRYAELNPIRAGLVAGACWRWSSALARCHRETDNGLLTMVPWQDHWV